MDPSFKLFSLLTILYFFSLLDLKHLIFLLSFHGYLWFLEQLLRNKLVSTARKSMRRNVNLSQLYQSMKEAYDGMQTPLVPQMLPTLVNVLQQFPIDLKSAIFFWFMFVLFLNRGWESWRNLQLNWLLVTDILTPLSMRLSLMWIRILMIFCKLKLKSSASAICCRHWWLGLVLLLCLFWRRYQLQCFGGTSPSWQSRACREISFGREYCIFSLLQVDDTSTPTKL